MKRFSKMSHGRSSSSKTGAAAYVTGQTEVEEIIFKTTQRGKFVSLNEDEEEEEEDEAEAGYQLRQNLRRITSSSKNGINHQKKFSCTKCGKAFQSSKAMCGHMACHSWKDKTSAKKASKQKMAVMDSESDTESGVRKLRMRLRFKKQKSVANWKPKGDVFNNCSSGVSGIEQEQEEVAISLMMLSRDSANWGGLNSVGDSSDNNSVVLQDRSISTKLGIRNNGLIFGYDVNDSMENCGSKKVKTSGDSEFGFVGKEAENVGTYVKINFSNKLAGRSKVEPHLSLTKLKTAMGGDGYGQIQRPKMDSFSTKSASNESAEMCKGFEDKAQHSYLPFNANASSHKSSTAASMYEADAYHNQHKWKYILEDNSSNVDYNWKKGKKHECPVCSKIFRSGQALGLHMRIHAADKLEEIKGDEVAANLKRREIQFPDSIDLNLPAPMDDEEASVSVANY